MWSGVGCSGLPPPTTDPAVFATLAPAEQQQILGAIRAVSQKLVAGEARGGSAGLAPKPPASPQDTGKPAKELPGGNMKAAD